MKRRIKKTSKDSASTCPCGNTLKGRPAWIQCDSCEQWWHGSCVSLTREICAIFKAKNLPYICPTCTVNNLKIKDTVDTSKPESGEQFQYSQDCTQADKEDQGNSDSEQACFTESSGKTKNILIVDGLKNPSDFQNSRIIKEEIRKFKGDIRIKYAYPLNRGGIAIHTESEEDFKLLKSEWPEEAFHGGSSISFHENDNVPRCIFKNVLPHLKDEFITLEVKKQIGISVNVRRLKYRDTGKPMPVVIVTCASFEDLQLLFKSKMLLCRKSIRINSYKSKKNTPVRCYNCQEFGHVAAICKNSNKCEYCSEDHSGSCSNECKCVNCGNRHPSSSASCPVFIAIKERLLSRN